MVAVLKYMYYTIYTRDYNYIFYNVTSMLRLKWAFSTNSAGYLQFKKITPWRQPSKKKANKTLGESVHTRTVLGLVNYSKNYDSVFIVKLCSIVFKTVQIKNTLINVSASNDNIIWLCIFKKEKKNEFHIESCSI